MKIHIVTLGVRDLKKATAFYEALGLTRRLGPDSISFFELDGVWLSLYPVEALAEDANAEQPVSLPAPPAFTLAHILSTKPEVDAFLEKAEAAGATIQVPAEEKFWGGYSGYFSDLDGHLWEIAWNPEFDL